MRTFLTFWLLLCCVALAVHLGTPPLLDADEGRNAEVAREMAATNDYVMPRLNALPYLDKPVVYFAAEAALMEVLGPTELAARLPAYLFTLATAAALFWFARRLWGGEAPWIAAIVFLAMPLTVAFARTVIFDSALMFFTTVALMAFYFAVEGFAPSSGLRPPSPPQAGEKALAIDSSVAQGRVRGGAPGNWAALAWLSMGLAMITKGPVTFILVLFVAIPYAWKRKRLRALFPPLGLILFAAVVAPWVWGVTRVVPEFLEYVLVTETAARMATKALKRTGPPWYFVPYLIGGALPWSIVAIASWRSMKRPSREMAYLLLWIGIPFLFFSLSQSKRPQYILPLLPAVALLVAHAWQEARTRAAAVVAAGFGALLVVAPFFFHRTKMKPEIAAVADETAWTLGAVFLAGGLIALFVRRRELALVALSIPVIALPAIANPLMVALGERRSAKSFVAELAPHLTPQSEVVGVEAFTGSMAFYLQRPITVVSEDGSELTSNYLILRYDRFTSNPAAPLKPLAWFERTLADRSPRVYVLRNDDAKRRALLESRGWRLVADGAHHVGYAR